MSKHRGSGCVISRSSNSLTDHKAVLFLTVSLPCAVCTTLPMHPRMLRWNGPATLHMKSVARTPRQTIPSWRCIACSSHNGSPGHKLVSRAETSECHGSYSRGCCRHSYAGSLVHKLSKISPLLAGLLSPSSQCEWGAVHAAGLLHRTREPPVKLYRFSPHASQLVCLRSRY